MHNPNQNFSAGTMAIIDDAEITQHLVPGVRLPTLLAMFMH